MSYDNTNRGSVWSNDRKQADTHADYTGTINVGGVEYWLNVWDRKPGANEKAPLLTMTVKKKEPKQKRKPAPQTQQDDFDDSIPF